MAFKLGDVIIDRAQFGYGQTKAGVPLYALTQLKEFSIELTADSTDITDARGNLVYRKYTGKKGEVTAQNAFMNFAVICTHKIPGNQSGGQRNNQPCPYTKQGTYHY